MKRSSRKPITLTESRVAGNRQGEISEGALELQEERR